MVTLEVLQGLEGVGAKGPVHPVELLAGGVAAAVCGAVGHHHVHLQLPQIIAELGRESGGGIDPWYGGEHHVVEVPVEVGGLHRLVNVGAMEALVLLVKSEGPRLPLHHLAIVVQLVRSAQVPVLGQPQVLLVGAYRVLSRWPCWGGTAWIPP